MSTPTIIISTLANEPAVTIQHDGYYPVTFVKDGIAGGVRIISGVAGPGDWERAEGALYGRPV